MTRALIPNSTQVPDVILDHWMGGLSGAEFKVLLYVARRTYGFGKDSDAISLNQLARGIRRRDGSVLDRGTGLSRSGVKAACVALIGRGLLIRTANTARDGREAEESTYRLNLYAPLPGPAPDDGGEGVGRNPAHPGRTEAYPEVGRPSADPGPEKAGGRPAGGRGVGQFLAPQETGSQETPQETAAAGGIQQPAAVVGGADAALVKELVQELVRNGVGRGTAGRLAAEKPDVCRRCLEYLPFAAVRTTPGAWLAAAIRDEFGPPERFVKRAGGPVSAATPSPSDRAAARTARLRADLARLERARPDALAAFRAFVAAERDRAERFAGRLSPRGRAEFLAQFDTPDHRLALYERWVATTGRGDRPAAGAIADHPLECRAGAADSVGEGPPPAPDRLPDRDRPL
ncbi:MAG: replication protein [Gemmataceae bacterium]|nr:replication protein [Gemmataceae bacterium]